MTVVTRDDAPTLRAPIVAAVAGIVAIMWVSPLPSDLWLDETGTIWTIGDGLWDAIMRPIRFQFQSPLYSIIAWLTRHVLGTSEIALRIPPLLAAAAGVLIFRRLADRLLGSPAALPTTIIFASMSAVMFAAGDARPYAFALCGAVASTLALIRWLDDARPGHAVRYVALAALTVYLHYMFAVTLLPHAIYVLLRWRSSRVRARALIAAVGALAILLIPGVMHLAWTSGQPQTLVSPPEDLSIRAFIRRLFPPALVFGMLGGLLLARLTTRARIAHDGGTDHDRSIALIAAMAFVPTIVIYAASHAVSPKFFVARYLLTAAPGLALLAGRLLSRVRPASSHPLIVAVVVLGSILTSGGRYHTQEHWGAAAAIERAYVVDPRTPVLFHSGFIEGNVIAWLTDHARRQFLLAPADAYPFEGRLIAMPYNLSAPGREYLSDLIPALRRERAFVLVSPFPWIPFRTWLDERLAADGFRSRLIGRGGMIEIHAFERTG